MALVRTFTKDDVTYPEAYSRITSIRCDKSEAFLFVCTYENENSRFLGDSPVHTEELATQLSTLNGEIFSNSYAFIKTCPGFETSIDHLVVEALLEAEPEAIN